MFHNKATGYSYTRINNPTIAAFESKMAALEHGIAAIACASGMAAFVNTPPMDIVAKARGLFNLPLAVYNVSGEYSMVKAAARNGWIDEKRIVMENMTAMNFSKSDELYQKSKTRIPGGVNSPVRAYRSVGRNPIFIGRADCNNNAIHGSHKNGKLGNRGCNECHSGSKGLYQQRVYYQVQRLFTVPAKDYEGVWCVTNLRRGHNRISLILWWSTGSITNAWRRIRDRLPRLFAKPLVIRFG